MLRFVALIPLAWSIGGCAYNLNDVADPSNITLKQAVFDVEDAMNEARLRAKDRPKVGMYLDEATVVFNVSAKETNKGGLTLSPTIPFATFGLPVNASGEVTGEGNRGNQVTLKFKNVYTVTPVAVNAAEIADARKKCDAIKEEGVKKDCVSKIPKPIYRRPPPVFQPT